MSSSNSSILTIALDIDRTLVYSTFTSNIKNEWLTLFDNFIYENYTVFIRPHLKTFLEYLFQPENNFKIGIYTAGGEEYAKLVVEKLFIPNGYTPSFIFISSNSFENVSFDDKQKSVEYLSYKLRIPTKNILLIDDSSAIKKVNPEGCYLISKFYVSFDYTHVFNENVLKDEGLLECIEWLSINYNRK